MSENGEDDEGPAALGRRPRRYDGGRMLALSDGVFAFAITLLVLDLVTPTAHDRELLSALVGQWPQYLAYVVSFATIGAVWLAHNAVTDHMTHTDSTFMRLNLVLLLLVSFMPFPTKILSMFVGADNPERVAVTLYGITLLVLMGLTLWLWSYARGAGLLEESPGEELVLFGKRFVPGIILYAVLIVVGLFVPLVAAVGYLVIALYFIIPFRLRHAIRHLRGRSRRG